MKELDKPIGRVWRRLRLQRFLTSTVWCLAAGLALATVVLGVEKLGQVPVPGASWWPFAIAGGLSLVVAGLIAAFTGPDRTDAAVALDRAFGLNERLSTALTLPENLRETHAGRALISDAIRHVADLDVTDRFGLSIPRRAWVPIVPVLLAGVITLVPEWSRQAAAIAKASTTTKADAKAVVKSSETLGRKMAEQRKQMDKQKFAEAERLLAEVEKAANELAKAPPAQKDKAMMELNKLTDALKDRQKQLGSPEQVNRQLQQLKEMSSNGPADDFNKALSKGDFEKASNEMKQLKDKLLSGKMSEKEKEDLKKQIQEMSQQLQKLANLDERKKQLEEAKKNGGLSQEQFDKEMAKLNDQSKNLEKLQKMAQQLAKAGEAMEKGDAKKAAEALGMSEQQLQKMAQELAELQSLDSALAELQDAKNGMNGEGQDGMNQFGDGFNQLGQNTNRRNQGDGMGNRGIGDGDRAEAPDDTASYNTRSKNQYTKGAAVIEGTAPPTTQSKGLSTISIQGEIETNAGSAADALTNQKIPKSVEKHIRGYFDQINKGQ
ncbi:hypothetical protein P12x_000667 [Tundrisphaera lichenicola]|uniref:hypothetical protein n=1 Tax=Tundrisphaera lichenicola TaxID=2029860 RepID=UPI003EB6B607